MFRFTSQNEWHIYWYLLVRWIEEESVGIMPSSNVHQVAVAVVRLQRLAKKYYDANILKMFSK